MIQLSGAGKRFGPKLLFENADWLITPQDRVGLVGANGTGKTTITKILAGLYDAGYSNFGFALIPRLDRSLPAAYCLLSTAARLPA
jgi:ABC-type bacteriocin/lantibiotic exporter with double-glycine peptidase domain